MLGGRIGISRFYQGGFEVLPREHSEALGRSLRCSTLRTGAVVTEDLRNLIGREPEIL